MASFQAASAYSDTVISNVGFICDDFDHFVVFSHFQPKDKLSRRSLALSI